MHRLLLLIMVLLAPAFVHAQEQPIVPALIPQPVSLQMGSGHFIIDAQASVHAPSRGAARVAERLNGFLVASGRKALPISAKGKGNIRLELARGANTPYQGYQLDIDDTGIRIRAASEAGLFYGAVTLWQLLTQGEGDRVVLPVLHIEDAPRFSWRGYMLDSARHFQSVEQIKQILDVMALHKLDVFHWHLTDDQGWRIEIKRYPRLTDIGGCRIPVGDAAIDPGTGNEEPYCGYYSQQDIRDIVAYAAARHITVVPEIDVPGHATAAIAAYPDLGSEGRAIEVTALRGIHANLFNVEESTFTFLGNVFAEVGQLFPGRYIHVGGDEAIKDQWKASPRIQQRMRELGLKEEAELQAWFMRRLEAILEQQGKRLLGWDEILEGGLPAQATVMSWRGTEGGLAAAKAGHDVVMSPVSHIYFDYLASDAPDEYPGRPSPRLLPLQKVYAFEPIPPELEAPLQRHVLGLQANMWTTENRAFAGVLHNTFPRLLAVAEIGWTPRERKDYASFLQRLPAWLPRYRALGVGYASNLFDAQVDAMLVPGPSGAAQGEAQVALANPLGYPIRYAIDGDHWRDYQRPLRLKLPTRLQVQVAAQQQLPFQTQSFVLEHTRLLGRDDEQLPACDASAPRLRMEDDGPFAGERARFNVSFMAPCWLWKAAPMQGITALEVRAGRIPYWIRQGADEDAKRAFLPARSAHGELDVRAKGCEGKVIATAVLPERPDANGFIQLRAALSRRIDENADLCIRFSGNTRPDMWLLDHIQLVPGP